MTPAATPPPAEEIETMPGEIPPVPEAAPPREDFELPVAGFQGTPEEIERQWFEQVYKGRGDTMLQLTWRAVLMGSVLGGVLSLTNLYIGLKTGWGFGVAITACILSYAIWTALYKARSGQDPDDRSSKTTACNRRPVRRAIRPAAR